VDVVIKVVHFVGQDFGTVVIGMRRQQCTRGAIAKNSGTHNVGIE
jgi:hypothetical protein